MDGIIDSGAGELMEASDPIAAEAWASSMLDAFDAARRRALLDGMEAPSFEEALLHRCQERRDHRAVVVAAALAAVLPPPLDRSAASVVTAQRRSVPGLPDWLGAAGTTEPTRGWIAADVFGDQETLIVAFALQDGSDEHALVVLVDHNLSGQAKDAWIGGSADQVVESWKSAVEDPHMLLAEVPVQDTLGRLRDAMAMSDLWNGDTEFRSEEFARNRALIWARLRRVGLDDGLPAELRVTPPEREALVAEFMSSPEGRAVAERLHGADVELLAHHIVDLRSDYEGRPLRWSPMVVARLMGDLAPRKLLLDADEAAALPGVIRAFVRFCARRTGLDDAFLQETLEAVDHIESDYLDRMGDPAAAGPAKAVLATLLARGVDLSDIDAVNAALDQSVPMKLPKPAPRQRRSAASAPDDVVASARASPVLARFDQLTSFFGDGRKLTQTGHPTLADARALVPLLGTEDRLDERIGNRTFKTRSAADLPELGFLLRWATTAGALRKEHGKLRATAAWAKLAPKPLQRWLKAADALATVGPLAGFHTHHRYRGPHEILDEMVPEILDLLVGGDVPFESVLDEVCGWADAEYEWLAPFMQDPEHRRRSHGWDLDRLVRIFGWAGVAERVGASVEPDPYGGDRLVGGTLRLTTVGRWWLTGRASDEGQGR